MDNLNWLEKYVEDLLETDQFLIYFQILSARDKTKTGELMLQKMKTLQFVLASKDKLDLIEEASFKDWRILKPLCMEILGQKSEEETLLIMEKMHDASYYLEDDGGKIDSLFSSKGAVAEFPVQGSLQEKLFVSLMLFTQTAQLYCKDTNNPYFQNVIAFLPDTDLPESYKEMLWNSINQYDGFFVRSTVFLDGLSKNFENPVRSPVFPWKDFAEKMSPDRKRALLGFLAHENAFQKQLQEEMDSSPNGPWNVSKKVEVLDKDKEDLFFAKQFIQTNKEKWQAKEDLLGFKGTLKELESFLSKEEKEDAFEQLEDYQEWALGFHVHSLFPLSEEEYLHNKLYNDKISYGPGSFNKERARHYLQEKV